MKRRRWDLGPRSRRRVLAPAGKRFPIRGLLAEAAVLRRDRGGAVAFTVSRLIASPASSSGAVRRALMSSLSIPPRVLPPPAPALTPVLKLPPPRSTAGKLTTVTQQNEKQNRPKKNNPTTSSLSGHSSNRGLAQLRPAAPPQPPRSLPAFWSIC